MSQFLTKLDVVQVESETNEGRGTWQLHSPLTYQSDLLGKVEVPAGFTTDFASVPRVPIIFAIAGDRGDLAAAVHDYLYDKTCNLSVTRKQADLLFKEALLAQKVPSWISWGMYFAVRAFASKHWRT